MESYVYLLASKIIVINAGINNTWLNKKISFYNMHLEITDIRNIKHF